MTREEIEDLRKIIEAHEHLKRALDGWGRAWRAVEGFNAGEPDKERRTAYEARMLVHPRRELVERIRRLDALLDGKEAKWPEPFRGFVGKMRAFLHDRRLIPIRDPLPRFPELESLRAADRTEYNQAFGSLGPWMARELEGREYELPPVSYDLPDPVSNAELARRAGLRQPDDMSKQIRKALAKAGRAATTIEPGHRRKWSHVELRAIGPCLPNGVLRDLLVDQGFANPVDPR